VVQRNFIQPGGLNCSGIVPAGNFGRCDHHTCGSRQRRSMQRLANMANRVLSGAVLVQEAATRGEIEQREADDQGAIAAQCVLTRAAKLVATGTFHVLLSGYIYFAMIRQLKPRFGCFFDHAGGPAFLTQQRFSPKLRLNKHMAVNRINGRVIGLMLLLLFLGAQIHLLSDLDSGQAGPHLCPICSILSFAILLALPVLCSLPVMGRAEQSFAVALATQGIFRSTSPRAPPVL